MYGLLSSHICLTNLSFLLLLEDDMTKVYNWMLIFKTISMLKYLIPASSHLCLGVLGCVGAALRGIRTHWSRWPPRHGHPFFWSSRRYDSLILNNIVLNFEGKGSHIQFVWKYAAIVAFVIHIVKQLDDCSKVRLYRQIGVNPSQMVQSYTRWFRFDLANSYILFSWVIVVRRSRIFLS